MSSTVQTNRPPKPVIESEILSNTPVYWSSDTSRAENVFVKESNPTSALGYHLGAPMCEIATTGSDKPIGVSYNVKHEYTIDGETPYDRAMRYDRSFLAARRGPLMMYNYSDQAIQSGRKITNASYGHIQEKTFDGEDAYGSTTEYIRASDWGYIFLEV